MSAVSLFSPPKGTHYVLPPSDAKRRQLVDRLRKLYSSWGYQSVDTPAIDFYDPQHPAAARSFTLSDSDAAVLALRADFTPAIAKMVQAHYPQTSQPLRFQYSGKTWQTVAPDLARTREFTQVGIELVGVSNARADAEVIHLARQSLYSVGLLPRLEIGHPGFVRTLFQLAGISAKEQEQLAYWIDNKSPAGIAERLSRLGLAPDLHRAILLSSDLYGDMRTLGQARALAPWPEALAVLDRLEAVINEFDDPKELSIDLAMARRLDYYTGVTFRAYTPEFGQPILGGGRYDHALLPYAAGFSLGLERMLSAIAPDYPCDKSLVLSLDDAQAQHLRNHGVVVERALSDTLEQARLEAQARDIPFVLGPQGLESLGEHPETKRLQALLSGVNYG